MNKQKENIENYNRQQNAIVIAAIRPPAYKLHELKNFDLSKIPVYFRIADFERFKTDHHVNEIITAIRANKFHGLVLEAYLDSKKRWVIVDGQYRLAALYCLNRDYGLAAYDLVIYEILEKNAIATYRYNNMGKRLNVANHLKAIEKTRIFNDFFDGLSDILCHDDGRRDLSYSEVLTAHYYATTGMKSLAVRTLEYALNAVTKDDVKFIRTYQNAILRTMPTRTKGDQFRPMFMRCSFSAAHSTGLNSAEIVSLIEWGLHNKDIIESLDNVGKGVYVIITRKFVERARQILGEGV